MIKNILFDLDGTLLNMDQDKFLKLYMISLYSVLKDEYKDINELTNVIETGVKLMFNNDGSKTNEEVLKALEKIGAETVNFNKLNHLFEDEVLKVDPIVLKDNYTIDHSGKQCKTEN